MKSYCEEAIPTSASKNLEYTHKYGHIKNKYLSFKQLSLVSRKNAVGMV